MVWADKRKTKNQRSSLCSIIPNDANASKSFTSHYIFFYFSYICFLLIFFSWLIEKQIDFFNVRNETPITKFFILPFFQINSILQFSHHTSELWKILRKIKKKNIERNWINFFSKHFKTNFKLFLMMMMKMMIILCVDNEVTFKDELSERIIFLNHHNSID